MRPIMNTDRLKRFLIGFQTDVMPLIGEDNTGLVYEISQSLAEDPLVRDIVHMKTGSGHSTGTYMGVEVKTVPDFGVKDYRGTNTRTIKKD
jgi:hypothetical protein